MDAAGGALGFAWVAPVADAVTTVLAAVGEGGLGATYCACVRAWHEDLLERSAPTIGRVPKAVYNASLRLPADRRQPHTDFVAAIAAAAALVRKPRVQRGRRYCPSTADSLSSEVRGRSGARAGRLARCSPPPLARFPCLTVRVPVWQCFAAPVPACPCDAEALLEALRTWARAEADRLRASAASSAAPAADYASRLRAWASGVGDGVIPCVPAKMRAQADASRGDAPETRECPLQRLERAVGLYRREHRRAVQLAARTRGDPTADPAHAPPLGSRRKDSSRKAPADRAALAGRDEEPSERTEADELAVSDSTEFDRACAVRVTFHARPERQCIVPAPLASRCGVHPSPPRCRRRHRSLVPRVWQAADVRSTGSRTELATKMLAAIASARAVRLAAGSLQADGPVAKHLMKLEDEWATYSKGGSRFPRGPDQLFRGKAANASGLVAELAPVHETLRRVHLACEQSHREKQAARADAEAACAVRSFCGRCELGFTACCPHTSSSGRRRRGVSSGRPPLRLCGYR